MSWLWPLLAGFCSSLATLLGSGLLLTLGKRAEAASTWLLSFAIGTLLGTATLDLLPAGMLHAKVPEAMALFLAGMVAFIAFERVIRWRHPHEPSHGRAHAIRVDRETARLVLWGDTLHNFVDGMVLGAAFSSSLATGLSATLAVVAHELPQEIGDFAVLLSSGLSKRRALLLNYLVALTVIPGIALTLVFAEASAGLRSWLLPPAAGTFIYIALADLVPALHHRRGAAAAAAQLALLLAGIGIIALVSEALPD
jgi:zinc and cadmium transporter